jgi:hypothetical protein
MSGAGKQANARDAWADHERRQEFEHELIDRKTTWLLGTQAILFAAYGVALDATATADDLRDFQTVVSRTGLAIAAIMLVGVAAVINSKRLAWRKYRAYFEKPRGQGVPMPEPRDGRALQWGVRTWNTVVSLLPDIALPVVFILAWLSLTP